MKKKLQKQISKITLIYKCYLRFLALICLGLSVFYWVRLIGIFPGVLWRFDLMPWQWQFASAILAVVYPIALIGLWMYSLWGVVLWCVAAFTEILTRYYSDYQPFIPLFYGILFLTFIILQIIMIFLKRNHAREY
ncbi:DUF6163 family protein [Bartonella taylorii]|uniref:DUF6163 family protein n=1 Tax=Bartonella taylorii TaxID=33046 RepID=UPI001ABAE730|nr:DUF6163 family protein [Bartonella taylorii]